MFQSVNFCGVSGRSYQFQRIKAETATWTGTAGLVIFAAPDGRVIKIVEQFGKVEDVGAIWRWREARRFGATQVFVRAEADISNRHDALDDLIEGLDPVCETDPVVFARIGDGLERVLPIAA